MTSVTPTVVQVNNDSWSIAYGSTDRRLVSIYVEASPAIGYTLDLSTYVSGLSAIKTVDGNAKEASPATFSGTTITFANSGSQGLRVTGYYT